MNSIEKGLWILKKLGEPPYKMTLTEISQKIELPRSGIYKIISSFVKQGFVDQDSDKKYHLGATIFRLGSAYGNLRCVQTIISPLMKDLQSETGETVVLFVLEGVIPSVAFGFESSYELKCEVLPGKRGFLNSGANGKLLGAHMPKEKLMEIVRKCGLQKETRKSITSIEELEREYEIIRSNGYAYSEEETAEGIFAVSAPIRDCNGIVWASLGMIGAKIRLQNNMRGDLALKVKEKASKISRKLGCPDEVVFKL